MKPAENIENLIKNVELDTNAERDKAVLDDVLNALEESKKLALSKVEGTKPAVIEPNIWRTIMKSRITKLAAAAAVLIAVIAIVNYLGGSIDSASVAFAQATEALKKVPWVHTTGTNGYEGWINHESQVSITRAADGKIEFTDYRKSKKYEYDPESNTLTISTTSTGYDELPLQWQQYVKLFAQRQPDIEISRRKDRVGGDDVKIYILNWAKGGFLRESEVTVDVQSDLPLFAHLKITRPSGTLITDAKTFFEYPQDGPTTIYDVGVPRSAKVFDYSENLANASKKSAEKLKKLGAALFIYAAEHQGKCPNSLQQLDRYIDNLQWFTQHVEYLGKGTILTGSTPVPIAYDRTFLKEGNSTNILFNDGHVLFGDPKQFKK